MLTVESEYGPMTGTYVEIGPLWGKASTRTLHAAGDDRTKCGIPMIGPQRMCKKVCRRCFRG